MNAPLNKNLSPWTGEFLSSALEDAYLDAQASETATRLRIIAGVALFATLAYLPVDRMVFTGGDAWPVLALRVLMGASAGWMLLWLPSTGRGLRRATLLSVLLFMGLFAWINALYVNHLRADGPTVLHWLWISILVLLNYAYIPHSLRTAAVTSLGLTVMCLITDLQVGLLSTQPLVGLSVAVVTLNLAGLQFCRVTQLAARREYTLLHTLFPAEIARRLKLGPLQAEYFDSASVLFADIVGFTELSTRMRPAETVQMLDELFSAIDTLTDRHGVEKIKTIGDCTMIAAGVPIPKDDHAQRLARFALDVQALVRSRTFGGVDLQLRVGMHSGRLFAGVIGGKRQLYDLWGDTVNTASRMESHGVAGEIQISAETRALLGEAFACRARGPLQVKGIGQVETWLLGESREGVATPNHETLS
jgi:class 3 adenylate cyclase